MPKQIPVVMITHAGGAHVTAYLSALAATPHCRSVVLADPDGRWEKEARKRLGPKLTKTTGDVGQALRGQPAGMSLITMEARLAPPRIAQALDANWHVFAEKPSCVRAADFEPLVAKADARHRHLMLAFANRTNPEVVAAREIVLQKKQLGRIFGLEMHLVADQTRLKNKNYHRQWFADRARAGGGHLIWLGIHWLDLAMHITGSRVTEAAGFTANVGGQPIKVEDSAAAALKFDSGFLGTITSGYYLKRGYNSHIKIWGERGWLHLDSMAEQPLTWMLHDGPQAGKLQTFAGSKNPRGYTPFVQQAVAACAEMTDPPINSGDSLHALRTVFGIYRAAAAGRTEKI